MNSPEILVLGGPNSGKTHYIGQLYGRLMRNPGKLLLRKEEGIPDLSPIREVLNCLENGNAASHTPTSTWLNVYLPLRYNNEINFEIYWPDYGGEQLSSVFENRSVNEEWQKKLKISNGWVLLIRLSNEVLYPNHLDRVDQKPEKENTGNQSNRMQKWDANAYWVEKLQILLHIAQKGTINQLKEPKLAVLLSCYDEIQESMGSFQSPESLLKNKLPMLFSFIKNNWDKSAFSVWGLSSLGDTLTPNSNAENFIDEGPESQGWIVSPHNKSKNQDISLPITWLLEELI